MTKQKIRISPEDYLADVKITEKFWNDSKLDEDLLLSLGLKLFTNTFENQWVKYIYIEGKGISNKTLIAGLSNIADYFIGGPGPITQQTRMEMGRIVSFYRMFIRGCNKVEGRYQAFGYKENDIVSVQEGLCIIYRHNLYDKSKVFLQYWRQYDEMFDDNHCCKCPTFIQKNCRLCIPQLDLGKEH